MSDIPFSGMLRSGDILELPSFTKRIKSPTKWPTPTVQDGENNGGAAQFKRNSLPLNAIVCLYPTPSHRDATAGPGKGKSTLGGDNLRTRAGGALNPAWVDWLMGFPEGYTTIVKGDDNAAS